MKKRKWLKIVFMLLLSVIISGKDGGTISAQASYSRMAGINVSVSEITANAKGVTSASSVDVTTGNRGGFSVTVNGSSWLAVGKSSAVEDAVSELLFDGTDSFYVFVDINKETSKRTGVITITLADGTEQVDISVSQDALYPVLIVDSGEKAVDKDGNFYDPSVAVKTQNSGPYTVEVKNASWLKISAANTTDISAGLSKMTFDQDDTFYLVAAENTGAERTAEVVVTHYSETLSKSFTVTQVGTDDNYLEIDRETAYFDDPGETVSEAIEVTADDDTAWKASASAKWIKITDTDAVGAKKYASKEWKGTAVFYIYVQKNGTFKERSGYVTVSAPGMKSRRIYVSQVENEKNTTALLGELDVRVTQKTFNKGKSTQIKYDFPEGLYPSDVKKVTYSSNKPNVAKVSSKGQISGIRKGTAIITVKVLTEDGAFKTFRLKVVVGDRKVTVTQKK